MLNAMNDTTQPAGFQMEGQPRRKMPNFYHVTDFEIQCPV